MSNTYAYNTTILVRGRFYDAAGDPTDPPGVHLQVRAPDGEVTIDDFTDVGTAIVRVSEGVYTSIVRGSMTGRWMYQWGSAEEAADGSQPTEEGFFDVRPSAFAVA